MTIPLSEQLRALLRHMKQSSLARHEAFNRCEQGFAQRQESLDKTGQETRKYLDDTLARDLAANVSEFEQTQEHVSRCHQEDHLRLTQEYSAAQHKAHELFKDDKATVVEQFKESRWTIVTLNEADKKVARDKVTHAQRRLKDNHNELKAAYLKARRLIRSWEFARNIDVTVNEKPTLTPPDPWKTLDQRRHIVFDCHYRLEHLAMPTLLQGRLLPLITLLFWGVACLPAAVMDTWYVWLILTTVTILPGGWALRGWMKLTARRRVALLWQGLAQAFLDARPLRRLCLDQSRQVYTKERAHSRAQHRASLRKDIDQYRRRKKILETRKRMQLRQAEEKFRQRVEDIAVRRDWDLQQAQARFDTTQKELNDKYALDMQAAEKRQRLLQEESDRRHNAEWQQLTEEWQAACTHCDATLQAVDKECKQSFPPWEEMVESWQPPSELPHGLPMGVLTVTPALIPHSLPEDPRLPGLSLVDADLPALLPFPDKSSLLFKAVDQGRDAAVQTLEALLLRCWTSLPPGKLRCTIIDPVGRGENFAAFMHLADHDESLINSRIWTESSHIDQRLTDLTTHMETVLQKFLRNRYQTLAEYNAQAGEVAEPFRLLVVAHFPVNFSTDAARRLISLASAGARCGIYTLVMVDTKQPMPHGVELSDLEATCINLRWREGEFQWRDADFGDFPLTLAKPPPAEQATRILSAVGEKAKLANRVEVPFESIAPADEDWWTSDSRSGISVPLGRAGAAAFQMLTLGKGTSQHVLIAGKTGSGKSTLLHVLITQLALRYSPGEVEMYLIDFKKGVEFKTYASHRLPHARVVAVESEREFGLSVLQRLDAELVQRGEMFRKAGVNDLPSYRHVGELPRILLIVDEFQEFFVEDDKIAQETALLLDRLVRQGRAFGIHVILGSQTLGGAYSLARSTIDQMAVRIALQCSEADAHLILSKENSEARLLSRPGEAIYNAANGLLEGNNLFQIVWITDHLRDEYLEKTRAMAQASNGKASAPLIVFEGAAPSDLAKNPALNGDGLITGAYAAPTCWLGEAVAIKDPTAAVFRRQNGANLLIVGQNGEAALSLMVASLVSLAAQRAAPTSPHSLVLGAALEGEFDAFVQQLPEILPVQLTPARDLLGLLAKLTEELQRRQKENLVDAEPIFLFLFGLQRMRDIRRADDDFGYGRRGEEKPSPAKQFQTLMREGPPLGIFTIIWCDSLTNFQRTVDRQGMREFEMRVVFPMNAADSSNLMDSPLASRLGPHRALFYSEDQGKMEKFRPYGLPSVEWMREFLGSNPSARRPV